MVASDRPLTERQQQVLVMLLDVRNGGGGYPMTPNEIGSKLDLPSARRIRGPWSGPMAPAQRVIGTLNGLSAREMVSPRARRDGRSGSAYGLTDAGLSKARELKAVRG